MTEIMRNKRILWPHILEAADYRNTFIWWKNCPGYYRNRLTKGPSCNYCETGQLSRSND